MSATGTGMSMRMLSTRHLCRRSGRGSGTAPARLSSPARASGMAMGCGMGSGSEAWWAEGNGNRNGISTRVSEVRFDRQER